LFSFSQDVHSRFRTESHQDVVGRFNERFLLSLAHCGSCLVLDDELNVLPISSHVRDIQRASRPVLEAKANDSVRTFDSEAAKQLFELQSTMRDTQPIGSLIDQCKTLDQAKAVLTFVEAISEKTLRSTVALTAARGRGKSSALGLAVAGAIAYGYSNVFVTAPSPENLKSLFTMIFKGFDALSMKEHADYEIIQSTNPDFNKAVVRVNVFHTHRQTIQYIQPDDAARLTQAELLVIDEAAAIPLPLVKVLLGPYLVFISSTVNGYEGTGRSLSMKLLKQLRQESVLAPSSSSSSSSSMSASAQATGGRSLREITLDEPIRYALSDPIESWLNSLLCLNCSTTLPRLMGGVPLPSQCDLYYVERDTLFSGHSASEQFLQRMMALYVSSHYKNSPNDLQLMSDAPAHQLFVLLGPQSSSSSSSSSSPSSPSSSSSSSSSMLPDILAVIQVCLEGEISAESVSQGLGRGDRASGDLIPWTISQQYQTPEFASLSGARIVRIAAHPELMHMGYASRAMDLLMAFYQGKLQSLAEIEQLTEMKSLATPIQDDSSSSSPSSSSELQHESVAPRSLLPPLLQSLSDLRPPGLHYIGVSYGLTSMLFSFWSKCRFEPLYVRLTPNALTGEHTCIMIRVLDTQQSVGARHTMKTQWDREFVRDFRARFVHLCGFQFAAFEAALALAVINDSHSSSSSSSYSFPSSSSSTEIDPFLSFQRAPLSMSELRLLLTEYDLRRLESYADNLVDYHLILDLLPEIAGLYFTQRLPISLALTQQAILLGLGLQHKNVETLSKELGLAVQQVLAIFNKSVRKIASHLRSLVDGDKKKEQKKNSKADKRKSRESQEEKVAQEEEEEERPEMTPLHRSLDSDLHSASKAISAKLKKPGTASSSSSTLLSSSSFSSATPLIPASLSQFAIGGDDARWEAELAGAGSSIKRVAIKTEATSTHELKRKFIHENADARRSEKQHAASNSDSSKKKKKII